MQAMMTALKRRPWYEWVMVCGWQRRQQLHSWWWVHVAAIVCSLHSPARLLMTCCIDWHVEEGCVYLVCDLIAVS